MTSLADAVRAELPRLRRYAHGTVGSTELADRCVAECLNRLAEDPARVPSGMPLDVALYRLFHETSGGIEATPPPSGAAGAVERKDRLWRSLPYLPLGERQALMLVAVHGLSPETAATVLGVEPMIVRDRVARAERALLKRTAASVLIIEDEYLLAADLSRIVLEMGHEVCGTAAGRDEAVAVAARHRPSLVLADLQLRDGDSGGEAVDVIRRTIDTEVIYITAHPGRLDGRRVAGSMVIEKPVRAETLVAAMGEALGRAAGR